MESIRSHRYSIPSVQVTDDSQRFWLQQSSWFFYRGT